MAKPAAMSEMESNATVQKAIGRIAQVETSVVKHPRGERVRQRTQKVAKKPPLMGLGGGIQAHLEGGHLRGKLMELGEIEEARAPRYLVYDATLAPPVDTLKNL